MKKLAVALLLTLAIITPSYALNIVDTMLCKRVVLCANHMTVLVNRVTGEVKYTLQHNGKWLLLSGVMKHQYQSMYDAQTRLKLSCK